MNLVRSTPKAKGGEQPDNDAIVECAKSARQNLLPDIVSIGILILITGAILGILDAPPKKAATRKADPAELNAQNVRQDSVDPGTKPASIEMPMRSISNDASSPLTQEPMISGLPGSPYQPPPALKRFGTEPHIRRWRSQRQLFASSQPSHAGNSKRNWPKAFLMYLEAHQGYLKKILRHSEIASLNPRR